MKVFVTGGAGQVGSHVVEMLLERGDAVLAIDNYATGRPEHLELHARLRVVAGSIADKGLVDGLVGDFKPDVLVHTAASYKDPEDWYSDTTTNAVGGANLIKAAKTNSVQRFIYFQTALCYGVKPLQTPIRLDHPGSGEFLLRDLQDRDRGLPDDLGPRLRHLPPRQRDRATQRIRSAADLLPAPLAGEEMLRDHGAARLRVRQGFLARTVLKASDGIGQGAYHFSSGGDVAIRELYDAVVKAMRLNAYPEPEVRPIGSDDASTILLDPSRTFADFGKVEFTPLEDTVAAAVAYYNEFGVAGEYTHLRHEDKK